MHFARPVNYRPRSSRKSLAFPRCRLVRRLTFRNEGISLYLERKRRERIKVDQKFPPSSPARLITEEQRNVGRWTPAWRAATHFQFFSLPIYISSIRSLTSVKLWIIRRFCKSSSKH